MFNIFLSLFLSFAITFFSIPVIIRIAEQKNLLDIPDERKIHTKSIASLGGFGIFAGFILSCLVAISLPSVANFQYIFAAGFIIFFLGLKDDILIIAPIKKFIGQVLAALLVVYKGGIQINDMHGFLGIHQLPEAISLLLTLFTVLVVINAFNLIDGVDGLAGSLGLMVTLLLGLYFLKIEMFPYAILSLSLTGSLAAFLIFNVSPAKIFMGDTGSLLIGLIVSILVIQFINIAPGNSTFSIDSSPAIGFSLLIIPLLDTLRVFGMRMINRRSPFSPDRNHIHHLLLDKGLSHKAVTCSLVITNGIFIGFAYIGSSIGCTWLILTMSLFFFLGITILIVYPKRRLAVAKVRSSSMLKLRRPSTIVILTSEAVLEDTN